MGSVSPEVLRQAGLAIRDRRERLDLTQTAVAESTGINVRSYREIEKGRVQARRRTWLRIAQVLDIPVEEMDRLFGHNNGGTP